MGSHRLRLYIENWFRRMSGVWDIGASLGRRNIGNVRYLKEFLVNLLQSVDTLLELNVVSWKLGLKGWFDCLN